MFELSMATDSRVVSLGEVTHLWRRSLLDDESCGCGEPFSRCVFWQSVGQLAFGGWDAVDAHRVIALKRRLDRSVHTPRLALGRRDSSWRAEVDEYASYYTRIYRAAAHITGADVVIDSSKQASLPHILRHDIACRLSVVHCVRDSRAVAYSWTKKIARPEANAEHHTSMVRYSPAKTSGKWLQHNAVIESLRVLGVPVRRVRYEDWAVRPKDVVNDTLCFVNLERRSNEHLGDTSVDLVNAHTCSGNPARFKRGTVGIRTDEGWRSHMPTRSKQLVTGLTLPLLLAYKYRISTDLTQ